MTSLLHWGQAAFSPRRIALVGASEEKGKAGKLLMDNLLGNPDTQVAVSYTHLTLPTKRIV